MVFIVLLLFTSALIQASCLAQDCSPLFPRVLFGSQFTTFNTKPQKSMHVMFNTAISCVKSYVTVQIGSSVQKFYCKQQRLTFPSAPTFFHYIQNCTISIGTAKQFRYMVYGWNGQYTSTPKIHQQANLDLYKIKIPTDNIAHVVLLADFAPMKVRTYRPLRQTFDYLLKHPQQYPVDIFQINGDIAYNLNQQQGQKYLDFMALVSQVTPFWPLLITAGNHQSPFAENIQILSQTFVIYNISSEFRVQGYVIGPISLMFFDPHYEVYANSTVEKYQKMKTQLIRVMNQMTTEQNRNSRAVLVSTHYPLICSQIDPHCRDAFNRIPQIYKILDNYHLDLYIAGHMHQYQRIYPFVNGQFLNKVESPYPRGRFVSIVEGVAGNDIGIIDQPFPQQPFSAKYTYNETGFGYMTVISDQRGVAIEYDHFTTTNLLTKADSIIIRNKMQLTASTQ